REPGPRLPERAAEIRRVRHREPAEVGEEQRLGALDALGALPHLLDLLRLRHLAFLVRTNENASATDTGEAVRLVPRQVPGPRPGLRFRPCCLRRPRG